jgi:AAA+ superfamily predicted ATPase
VDAEEAHHDATEERPDDTEDDVPQRSIAATPHAPGTRKTLLARAVAGQAGVPFSSLSAASSSK